MKRVTSPATRTRSSHDDLTLQQAALVAGAGLLVMMLTAPFAEFYVYPRILTTGDPAATARAILAQRGLFLAGVFAHLITLISDVVVAWALYVLLAPTHRALSLLAAWFRLVYTVIALSALFELTTVFRMLTRSNGPLMADASQIGGAVDLLISSFRYQISLSLVLFGVHLLLLGVLVYRSGYIPKAIGGLLATAGVAYVAFYLRPYLYPDISLVFLMITFFAEPVFVIWLLLRGRRIADPLNA